jgi:hypothetical protein
MSVVSFGMIFETAVKPMGPGCTFRAQPGPLFFVGENDRPLTMDH